MNLLDSNQRRDSGNSWVTNDTPESSLFHSRPRSKQTAFEVSFKKTPNSTIVCSLFVNSVGMTR